MLPIKLKEQKDYNFLYTVTLQQRDINYMGHLGNDGIVSLMLNAQTRIFHSLGFSEENLGDGQTRTTISDLVVDFRSQASLFDKLAIESHIGKFRRNGFRIFHRFRKGQIIVALAETDIATLNRSSNKAVPVPKTFIEALRNQQG